NMGGKSTYMRQVALIVLLAHTGCFVPADAATIGPIDQIFTRIGASDDLASNRSTFMVEMSETAYILHHATEQSLVLMDEVGRGTSTFDGLALAHAVAEHLLQKNKSFSLFATHYFELTYLPDSLEIIDPASLVEQYVEPMCELRKSKGLTPEDARKQLQDTVVLGTMMMAQNDVDGLVSGAVHTTANTIRPALQLIKT
ncbi:hypothetical protein MM716_30580, partial [Klebsiella pneumoniae]|nr:hypothetical protein [Klebsiella pneumoniae]